MILGEHSSGAPLTQKGRDRGALHSLAGQTQPNKGVQETPYSVRSAPASGRA
jgi:hypothetical protein